MKYVIVKNNHSPVKTVFEYLELPELQNPNDIQKEMLKRICDGIEIGETNNPHFTEVKEKLNKRDWLFSVNGITLKLETTYK
jgi:hypothetical protein